MYQQLIDDFVIQEALPQTYSEDAQTWIVPLLSQIEDQLQRRQQKGPLILGINGAQGTGKSTLAKLLTSLLEARRHHTANLSIDDFYYSKSRRKQLAAKIHPLLASRGVPGTHDTQLLSQKLQELSAATASDRVVLPAFDKAIDDCIAVECCPSINGPIDVIIIEGWFIGALPQRSAELDTPLNALEAVADADGSWRHYVNDQLGQNYQELFNQLHLLIVLQAPDFAQVFAWRRLQEEKLRQHSPYGASGVMLEVELDRFIQHFERITRHCLASLPQQADIVYQLDKRHRITGKLDNTGGNG